MCSISAVPNSGSSGDGRMQSTGHTDTQLASLQHLCVITKAILGQPIEPTLVDLSAYRIAIAESSRRSCPPRPAATDRRRQPCLNAAPSPTQLREHQATSSTTRHEVESASAPVSRVPDSSYRLHQQL